MLAAGTRQSGGDCGVGDELLGSEALDASCDLLVRKVSVKRKSRVGCGVDRVGWSGIRMKLSPDRS